MNLGGGYWLWSAALRYLFMLPILWCIVQKRKETKTVLMDIRENPVCWILWSTVGFGLFYMPLSMASIYGESWFVAATWQITIVCSGYAWATHGLPDGDQIFQSVVVAVFSGVIATLLFFEATNMVKNNPRQLAVVEATQSGEVLFTLLGGILFLGDAVPSVTGFVGILIIVVGMTCNSLLG